MTITVVVCAFNEAALLPGCLFSLLAQTRPPDEILVVNNASTDATAAVARAVPNVRVLDEPVKDLVVARETGRRAARGDVLAYVDADCRVPIFWMERVAARMGRAATTVAVSGPYRFYDWDWTGRTLVRLYDVAVAPPTHAILHDVLGTGAILYGGNFAVRADALTRIRGFDQTSERIVGGVNSSSGLGDMTKTAARSKYATLIVAHHGFVIMILLHFSWRLVDDAGFSEDARSRRRSPLVSGLSGIVSRLGKLRTGESPRGTATEPHRLAPCRARPGAVHARDCGAAP